MSTQPEPEWLQTARLNGLTITQQGVDMAKLAAPVAFGPGGASLHKAAKRAVAKSDRKKAKAAEKASRSNAGQLDANPPAKKSKKGQVQVRHEENFQKKVLKLFKLCGWRVAHFRGVRTMRKDGTFYYATPVEADGKGFLDVLALKGSRIIVVELKATTKLTAEQQLWLDAFRAASVPAFVWTESSWPEIEKVLQS